MPVLNLPLKDFQKPYMHLTTNQNKIENIFIIPGGSHVALS